MIPTAMADLLKMCSILDEHELNSSDHLPKIVQIDAIPFLLRENILSVKNYNWSKLTANAIAQSYGDELYSSLQSLPLPHHRLGNNDTKMYYKTFVSKLQSASAYTLPKCDFKKHIKQKWSLEVAPFTPPCEPPVLYGSRRVDHVINWR